MLPVLSFSIGSPLFFLVEFPDDLFFQRVGHFVDFADLYVVLLEIVSDCGFGYVDFCADVFYSVSVLDDVVRQELHFTVRVDAFLDVRRVLVNHASVLRVVVHDVPYDHILVFLCGFVLLAAAQ